MTTANVPCALAAKAKPPYLFEHWCRRLFHPVVFLCTSNEQCLLSLESWFYRPSSKLILCTLVAPRFIKTEL